MLRFFRLLLCSSWLDFTWFFSLSISASFCDRFRLQQEFMNWAMHSQGPVLSSESLLGWVKDLQNHVLKSSYNVPFYCLICFQNFYFLLHLFGPILFWFWTKFLDNSGFVGITLQPHISCKKVIMLRGTRRQQCFNNLQ